MTTTINFIIYHYHHLCRFHYRYHHHHHHHYHHYCHDLGEGVQLNMFAYNTVIRSCEKGGQWRQALEFLGRILGEGAQRDTIS